MSAKECECCGGTGWDGSDCAEPKWIPVEERLPKEDVPVLVVDSRGSKVVAWYSWGEWFATELETEITHWMPLPLLPGQKLGR